MRVNPCDTLCYLCTMMTTMCFSFMTSTFLSSLHHNLRTVPLVQRRPALIRTFALVTRSAYPTSLLLVALSFSALTLFFIRPLSAFIFHFRTQVPFSSLTPALLAFSTSPKIMRCIPPKLPHLIRVLWSSSHFISLAFQHFLVWFTNQSSTMNLDQSRTLHYTTSSF